MTFYVQGLSRNELLPLGEIFKEPIVEKTSAILAEHAIDEKEQRAATKQQVRREAVKAYQSVKQLPQVNTALLAEQIMRSPVVKLAPEAVIDDAVRKFRQQPIRHLPIVSSDHRLVGIISERDILHHLGGVADNYQQQPQQNRNERVDQLMKSPVLTASRDTDVRYIARLFVEHRVGALPIVTNGELVGIITRSDVLNAVMRHFVMELWV